MYSSASSYKQLTLEGGIDDITRRVRGLKCEVALSLLSKKIRCLVSCYTENTGFRLMHVVHSTQVTIPVADKLRLPVRYYYHPVFLTHGRPLISFILAGAIFRAEPSTLCVLLVVGAFLTCDYVIEPRRRAS